MTNKTIDGLDSIAGADVNTSTDSLPLWDFSEGRTRKISPSGLFSVSTLGLTVSSLLVSPGNLTVSAGQLLADDGTASAPGISFEANPGTGFYRVTNGIGMAVGQSNDMLALNDGTNTGFRLAANAVYSWCSSTDANAGTTDLLLFRDAANTLAQRNAGNAQTFRVYGSFAATTTFASIFHNATNGGVSTSTGSFVIQPQNQTTQIAGTLAVSTSVSSINVVFGSGAPGLTAPKGSLYSRVDGSTTSTRVYVNTDGGTTWTALITAG